MLITLMSLAVVGLVLLERGWRPRAAVENRIDQRRSREQLIAELQPENSEGTGLKDAAAKGRAAPRMDSGDKENNVLAIEVSAGGKVIVKVYQRDGVNFQIQASSECICCHEEILSYLKLAQNLIDSQKYQDTYQEVEVPEGSHRLYQWDGGDLCDRHCTPAD